FFNVSITQLTDIFIFHLPVIFIGVLSDKWKVNVAPKIEALVTSCVVMPCTFQYPGSQVTNSGVRGIWYKQNNRDDIIYHEDSKRVADNFKGRTRLIGDLGQKNCTLELLDVRDHDNGPFCFRSEVLTIDNYSFEQNCVTISMISNPPQPKLQYMKSLVLGHPDIFKCFIRHTCPSHPPSLTWSHLNKLAHVHHKVLHEGIWEVESILAFIPTEQDDHRDITCKVDFYGHKTTSVTEFFPDKKVFYIVSAAVVGTSILFGVACFFMAKKYK
uniref:CD80-like immunoglobulin C2-set domain-containing protein n=1 Tax=Electrophorus electricus TaxID=8005 RepID=A0A4W4GG26_ELEEL